MGLYNYTYQEFSRRLKKLGFKLKRQAKGSHEIWYNEDNDILFTVPNHGAKNISIGVVRALLKHLKLKQDEFHNL